MKFQFISLVIIILLIFLRFYTSKPIYKNGDSVKITTKVYGEPIIYDNYQYLKIRGLKVYLPKNPEISYGDKIVVTGKIEDNKLKSPELLELITNEKGSLLFLREKLILFYKSNLPEPYSSLVAGIVIGSKNMPASFWEKLRLTGTAHVVVASGTNVTMTSAFLIGILTVFLKRKTAIWLTLAGIFSYVVISGFDAPIVRAGIMGSILLLGQETGRVVNTWRVLIVSGLLMLLINPHWLTDLGFILSFTATISLIVFQKRIDARLKIIPAIFREGLSTSLAAQIGVAPIIYVTFGQFSILSPVINALVLWTIPYIMILGTVGGLIGIVIPLLGKLILFLTYPILYFFIKIIELFA